MAIGRESDLNNKEMGFPGETERERRHRFIIQRKAFIRGILSLKELPDEEFDSLYDPKYSTNYSSTLKSEEVEDAVEILQKLLEKMRASGK